MTLTTAHLPPNTNATPFLGTFTKKSWKNASINFVMCLLAFNNETTERTLMKIDTEKFFPCLLLLLKSLNTFQFWLRFDNNNGHFTWKSTCALAHGSDWIGNSQPAAQSYKRIPMTTSSPSQLRTRHPNHANSKLMPLVPLSKVKFWWPCQNCTFLLLEVCMGRNFLILPSLARGPFGKTLKFTFKFVIRTPPKPDLHLFQP